MRAPDTINPSAKIHTPSFVVPLGKSMFNSQVDPESKDDVKTVEDFRAILGLCPIGSPERTYYNIMMANALMICRGMGSKKARRDAMLKDLELKNAEKEGRAAHWDRVCELFWAAVELIGVGGLVWTIFKIVVASPAIERLAHEVTEGYAAIATTLGVVLIWSTIMKRREQKRSLKSARYYRYMANRIWKMYRVGVKREYYHAINSVNAAWEQMTGYPPPDAEIAKQMLEALASEAEDYDQINGEEFEQGLLGELRDLLLGSKPKAISESRIRPAGVGSKSA